VKIEGYIVHLIVHSIWSSTEVQVIYAYLKDHSDTGTIMEHGSPCSLRPLLLYTTLLWDQNAHFALKCKWLSKKNIYLSFETTTLESCLVLMYMVHWPRDLYFLKICLLYAISKQWCMTDGVLHVGYNFIIMISTLKIVFISIVQCKLQYAYSK